MGVKRWTSKQTNVCIINAYICSWYLKLNNSTIVCLSLVSNTMVLRISSVLKEAVSNI